MMDQVAVPDAEAEIRWQNWKMRGVESDRLTTKRMRGLMLLIAAGFLVLFAVQLA